MTCKNETQTEDSVRIYFGGKDFRTSHLHTLHSLSAHWPTVIHLCTMKQKLLRLKQPSFEKNLISEKLRRHNSWETENDILSTCSTRSSSPDEHTTSNKLLRLITRLHKTTDCLTWNDTSETFTVAVGSADQRAPAQQQPIPVLKGSD